MEQNRPVMRQAGDAGKHTESIARKPAPAQRAGQPSGGGWHGSVLELQRSAGNRATGAAIEGLLQRQAAGRTQGVVRWFNADKGFGYIDPAEGGDQVFFSYSSVAGGAGSIGEGTGVSYVLTQSARGPQATDVTPTG
jgi:cold shock protein